MSEKGKDLMTDPSREHEVYSYEPFTQHAFYKEVNRALVERAVGRLPTGQKQTIVDMGCGTGAITQMVVEALQQRGLEATIIGVEPYADDLALAEERLAGSGMDVRFVQGDTAELLNLETTADALFFCNAIHLVPDKNEAIETIAQVLRAGGLFAFNSSFFNGAYPPGTEDFYRRWTIRAIRWLRRSYPDVRISREEKAPAMQWLSPEEYRDLLHKHGFDLLECALDEVQMDMKSFQDIGHYSLFIEGALPGAPLAAGAEALGRGVEEVFEEQGLTSVPRNWLQVVAARTGG